MILILTWSHLNELIFFLEFLVKNCQYCHGGANFTGFSQAYQIKMEVLSFACSFIKGRKCTGDIVKL